LADTTRFRHIVNGYGDKGWIVFVQRRFDMAICFSSVLR
jgi:hypothetical protein